MSFGKTFQPGLPGATDASRSFLLYMGTTARMLRSAFEEYMGVSETRLRLLAHLYAERELSQAALQKKLGIDGAAITRQVKQMEAEGLLKRWADPQDNRFTLVGLTPAGYKLVGAITVKGLEFERRVLQDMDAEDIACAAGILAHLRENLARLNTALPCRDKPEECSE